MRHASLNRHATPASFEGNAVVGIDSGSITVVGVSVQILAQQFGLIGKVTEVAGITTRSKRFAERYQAAE